MKVIILNSSDTQGGAARAAYRLHKALLSQDVDSQMLVQNKSSDDLTVLGPISKLDSFMSKLRPRLDSIPFRFFKKESSTLFSYSWLPSGRLIKRINELNPDIVHLHWVNAGMLRIEDIAKINAPIVWSLHDMWPFNGGWHYDEALVTSLQKILSDRVLNRKKNTYPKIRNMTVIGLSKWLQTCAYESNIFEGKKIINLPNPIDSERYKPFNKKDAKELWGLPKNKKLILFGAIGATSDPRKGFKELIDALSKLRLNDAALVVFGSTRPEQSFDIDCEVHYMGELLDDISLVTLYSAVDVMVVPSLQENLSNAIMESLSCGTPVVGFAVGGNSDLIEHKQTGYLAKPFDTEDLARGINFILNADNYSALSKKARNKVLCEFDSRLVAQKYIGLYERIIAEYSITHEQSPNES